MLLSLLDEVIDMALSAGADQADAIISKNSGSQVEFYNRALEKTERSDSASLSVRVFSDQRIATFSSSDLSLPALNELTKKTIEIAGHAPIDESAKLAPAEHLAPETDLDLELADPTELGLEHLSASAKDIEDALISVPEIEQSMGASASMDRDVMALKTSGGFSATVQRTVFGHGGGAVAAREKERVTDFHGASACFVEDLKSTRDIGEIAGKRAAAKLGAIRARTGVHPIVFEDRVAASFLSDFSHAISGPQVVRGTSFLRDQLGKRVFAEGIEIIDDPHIKRGLGSRLFDGEGVACKPMKFVENGILKAWATNAASAAQLSAPLTGHGTPLGGGVGYSNLFIQNGAHSVSDLISNIRYGLFVTDFLGDGSNFISGHFSQAVSGFVIENGNICEPFREATIAGTLMQVFQHAIPANDLEFRGMVNTPSLRVDGLQVVG